MKYALVLLLLLQDPAAKGTSPVRPLPERDAPAELRPLLALYESADKDFAWTLATIKRDERWRCDEISFPSPLDHGPDENKTVWGKVWIPEKLEKPAPAVVLLHWLKGSFEFLEILASQFADQGFVAMTVSMPHYGKRRGRNEAGEREEMITGDADATIANFRQAVLDVRRAGDWLASRKEVDPARIGLMGISLGAVVGSLVAGVDPQFSRSVLVIGGGDLPAICLNDSKEGRKIREKLVEGGWTAEKLAAKLKPVEPLTYASRVRAGSVLMINAEKDEIIPRAATERLWEAFGKPRIVWHKAGHYTIAFQLPAIMKDAAEHLKK